MSLTRSLFAIYFTLSCGFIPQVYASQMIQTSAWVNKHTSEEMNKNIKEFLKKPVVQDHFSNLGMSSLDAQKRLAGLNETELRQLSDQVDKAQYGGNILVTVLVVVLIIYLIQRI